MDGLFTFLGAFIGGIAASLVNWFFLDKQHKHALELQQRQFAQSMRDRELAQRDARGNLIADWDRQRQEREQQEALERQRDHDSAQLEALRQVELVMPSFSRASRALYEARQARHAAEQRGEEPPDGQPKLEEYVAQFNDLRYVTLGAISKIGDEKLRRRAGNLYQLDEAMALSSPGYWEPETEVFGGRDPVMLQVTWQEQLLRMSGKLYRGESIEGEFVEDSAHAPDPRRSSQPER